MNYVEVKLCPVCGRLKDHQEEPIRCPMLYEDEDRAAQQEAWDSFYCPWESDYPLSRAD